MLRTHIILKNIRIILMILQKIININLNIIIFQVNKKKTNMSTGILLLLKVYFKFNISLFFIIPNKSILF
jgi:hypothetical protein